MYCKGAGLSEGRVNAVLGRPACLAAGLLSATLDGPPAGWEDVLPDAMLAMARGQSRYRPSPRRVLSASQNIYTLITTGMMSWSIWTSGRPTVRLELYMLQLVLVSDIAFNEAAGEQ